MELVLAVEAADYVFRLTSVWRGGREGGRHWSRKTFWSLTFLRADDAIFKRKKGVLAGVKADGSHPKRVNNGGGEAPGGKKKPRKTSMMSWFLHRVIPANDVISGAVNGGRLRRRARGRRLVWAGGYKNLGRVTVGSTRLTPIDPHAGTFFPWSSPSFSAACSRPVFSPNHCAGRRCVYGVDFLTISRGSARPLTLPSFCPRSAVEFLAPPRRNFLLPGERKREDSAENGGVKAGGVASGAELGNLGQELVSSPLAGFLCSTDWAADSLPPASCRETRASNSILRTTAAVHSIGWRASFFCWFSGKVSSPWTDLVSARTRRGCDCGRWEVRSSVFFLSIHDALERVSANSDLDQTTIQACAPLVFVHVPLLRSSWDEERLHVWWRDSWLSVSARRHDFLVVCLTRLYEPHDFFVTSQWRSPPPSRSTRLDLSLDSNDFESVLVLLSFVHPCQLV